MLDFKTQILKDLRVFHNPGEFAEVTKVYYDGGYYTVPVVIDHDMTDRKSAEDHAQGIDRVEAVLYISHDDLGFVPRKGHAIELEEAGAVNMYEITKSSYEDGEIILELGAYEE